MIAHKDEGILMQTVTPPVFVLPGEGTSGAASLAFGHLVPALTLAEGGKGRGHTRKHQEHQKNHRQAKFWSSFEANLAKSTGR